MSTQYKSPPHKLIKFFEEARDKWREKTSLAKKELKLKGNRIKFLEVSKAKLKKEVTTLKQRVRELEASQKSPHSKKNT